MATATTDWVFEADEESWVSQEGAETTSQWQTADGDPASGCIEVRILGRNKTNLANHWEIEGTWIDLFGIGADQIITAIETGNVSGPYKWTCSEYNVGGTPNVAGPMQIRSSIGDVLIATIANAETGVSGTTAWAFAGDTGQQAVASAYQAASTSVIVRIVNDLDTDNNSAAAVTLRFDTVSLKITHESAAAGITILRRRR